LKQGEGKEFRDLAFLIHIYGKLTQNYVKKDILLLYSLNNKFYD